VRTRAPAGGAERAGAASLVGVQVLAVDRNIWIPFEAVTRENLNTYK